MRWAVPGQLWLQSFPVLDRPLLVNMFERGVSAKTLPTFLRTSEDSHQTSPVKRVYMWLETLSRVQPLGESLMELKAQILNRT